MKSRTLRLFVVAILTASAATSFAQSGELPRREMAIMAKELGRVLPLVVSDTEREKATTATRLAKSLDILVATARQVETKLPAANDDPIMRFVPTKLSATFRAAQHDLKVGNPTRMRARLLNVTGYCIACHTRTAGGEASIKIDPDFGESELSNLDTAEFYVATRQFSAAIVRLEYALNDVVFASRYPHRWERAAKKLLALTVRVQQKPRLVLELLAKIRDSKTAPAGLQRDLEIWKEAVKSWLGESEGDGAPSLANAKRLFKDGNARVAASGSSDAGLVDYLRASAMTHLLLQQPPSSDTGETLFLAGQVAEKVASLNLTTLHEIYYEACIRSEPHTALARSCFARFKASQLAVGVTDGKALVYPDDVYLRLDPLEALAK